MITIRSHDSYRVAVLHRDVTHHHPSWVHRQLQTASEAELQQILDALNVADFEETGYERDCDGILLVEDYQFELPDNIARGLRLPGDE